MNISRTPDQQVIADRMFNSFRDDLLIRDLSNTENYDKAILTLSASSLGLSLTAINFVVPIQIAIHVILLKTAWVLLVISIINSLVAYLISNKAIAIQMNNARDYYKNGIEDAFSRKNRFIFFNRIFNILTGVFFSVSIVLIVTFISLNIGREEIVMTDKKSNAVGDISSNALTTKYISTGSTLLSKNSANIPTMEQVPNTGMTSQGTSASSGSTDNSQLGGGSLDSSSSDNAEKNVNEAPDIVSKKE
ncbi:MAG: hypothetical protein KUG71_06640 [Porticoccaceae bacterium]|nr:hypothetical protein [Porticoccaceae bacterium]